MGNPEKEKDLTIYLPKKELFEGTMNLIDGLLMILSQYKLSLY